MSREESVNQRLAANRPERRRRARRREPVENDVYTGFVVRIIRAAGRRIADGDVEGLRDLLALHQELDAAIDRAVKGLHDDHGFSWGEIAQRIGITRQGVYKRWGADR